jgi:vancomycin resistance protein YoaR
MTAGSSAAGTEDFGSDPIAEPLSGPVSAPRRRGRVLFWLLFSFVFGFVLVGGIVVAGLYAYDQQYIHRVLPGVRIGQVDLSGLDETAARERLDAAYGSLAAGSIRVTAAGATTTISYSELGRQADLDTMVYEALLAGRDPSPVVQALGEIRAATTGITVEPRLNLNASPLGDRISAIARAADLDPVDASAVITPTGFTTTAAVTGRRVDVGSVVDGLVRQLSALDAPPSLTVNLAETALPPAVGDDAAQLARAQAAAMAFPLRIVSGTDGWDIPAATVHSWISFSRTADNRIVPVVRTAAVSAAVKALAPLINRPMVNATFTFQTTGKVTKVTPSQDGRTFDPKATTTAVLAAIQIRAQSGPGTGGPVTAVVKVVKPVLSTAQAKAAAAKVTVISSWTTYFDLGLHNGFGVNIWIPATTINGYVVQPGQTFSFWGAVGEVSLAKGYKLGGAIINGHSEEGVAIGGGICSTSTTLFNAVVRAGFTMGDRLNHYYYISRYPVGLDATVFKGGGSVQDMTWTNDTDYPILIRGINGPNSVRFDLYSVPPDRTVSFTKPIVTNYTKSTTKIVYTSALPAGTSSQIEYQDDGFDALVTRKVTDATGKVIHSDTYYSNYATITGLIMVGQKGAPNIPIPTYAP